MSRNQNSYFSESPARVDMPRSTIQRNQKHVTTFNCGQLIPFYIDEVLPGSSHSIDTAAVVRLQTLLNPIMDNLYMDTYYFFVPNRLVWEHWQEFCGENKTDPWVQTVEYTIPQLQAPYTRSGSGSAATYTGGFDKGSIADYFGIPTDVPGLSVNALPFRAYALICNEFFRDENLVDPLVIPTNDSTVTAALNDPTTTDALYDFTNNVAKGGRPFIAAKSHDYFTSALPAPLKLSTPVSINLEQALLPGDTQAPVYGNGKAIGFDYGTANKASILSTSSSSNTVKSTTFALSTDDDLPNAGSSTVGGNFTDVHALGLDRSGQSNIYADLEAFANRTVVTINQLRTAFQVQKFYEKQALGGTRYREILKSMFGVVSPDARLQIPEYLGGKRIPIAIQQIVQTSETGDTPQGNTAAMSVTSSYDNSLTKSFVEHGYIIGLAVVRYDHTYQQGVERMWNRKSRLDFYWPVFANLGAQPILNKEIFAQGMLHNSDSNRDYENPKNNEVFGYQEAWAEYRYKPNRVSGEMRSNYAASLDAWHLADDYSSLPALSADWIREEGGTVDRVIAVSQRVSDQFLADFYVKNRTTQPMPVYSVPGLVDHH